MQKVEGSLSRSGLQRYRSDAAGILSHITGVARGQDEYSLSTLVPVAVEKYVVSDGQLFRNRSYPPMSYMYARWPFSYIHVFKNKLCNAETCLEDAVAATQIVPMTFMWLH